MDTNINEPVGEVVLSVKVTKPPKGCFFRAHPDPDHCPAVWLYIPDRDTGIEGNFVLPRAMTPYLGELAKPYTLALCVTEQAQPFFWPIRLVREGERRNGWWTSARKAFEIAQEVWTRIEAPFSGNEYKIIRAPKRDTVPEFPEAPVGELLAAAFGPDNVIASPDHWIVKKIQGLPANDGAD